MIILPLEWFQLNPFMIYLDNNATTIVDKRVAQVVLEELQSYPSNPSSIHTFGKRAKKLLNAARNTAASFFKVKSEEVIFTSSATESLNTAIKGYFRANGKGHIISTNIEHAAIFNTLCEMQKEGFDVTFLNVGKSGALLPQEMERAITSNTKLIILSAANTETGVKTDLVAFGEIASKHGIPLIIDGVGILGKEPFSEIPKGVSAICFSGHKIHAPKGVGLLIFKPNFKFAPIITGGGQEFNKRAGSENLAAIIGMGKALEILQEDIQSASNKMRTLRDLFEKDLQEKFPQKIKINGDCARISNTSNLAFLGIDGESLLLTLDQKGLMASAGSACSAGAMEPSRILLNMGIERGIAKSSLRFSLSRFTTKEEIEDAVKIIAESIIQY